MHMYFCKSDGAKLYYQITGNGPPIVLLHPVGLCSEYWQIQEKAFSKKYTVISIDFPGYGNSDKPDGPFTLEDFASDVANLLRGLDFKSFVLCGQSLGGMVAQIVAVKWPELVAGLVLANTTPYGDQEVMEKRASIVETGGIAAEVDDTLKRWFTEETLRNNPSLVERIRRRLLANDPQVHGWTWRAIGNFNVLNENHAVRVPCLVIVGDRDPSTPPHLSKEIAKRISGARYFEIPEAAHMAFLEKPDAFISAVEPFLADIQWT